jgi:hypothetical protein
LCSHADPNSHLVSEMYSNIQVTHDSAMASKQGLALAKDLMCLSAVLVALFYYTEVQT